MGAERRVAAEGMAWTLAGVSPPHYDPRIAVGTVDGDCVAAHYFACGECRERHRIVPLTEQHRQSLDGSPQYMGA
jgi:hypothetical protein